MIVRGYLEWTADHLTGGGVTGPMIDGRVLASTPETLSWSREPDVIGIRMQDGSSVVQRRAVGPDAPVGMSPFRGTFALRMVDEGDYWALEEASQAGRPVQFWPRWWQSDVWEIAAGGAGRVEWRTSRRLPYQLAGVTQATMPPVLLVDGVALTLVASAPGAGEGVVPTSNTDPFTATVETDDLAGSARLVLRYPAEYYVLIRSISWAVQEPNLIVATLELEETILGEWEDWP